MKAIMTVETISLKLCLKVYTKNTRKLKLFKMRGLSIMIFSLLGFVNSFDKDEYFNQFDKAAKESKYSLLNAKEEILIRNKLMVKINI